MKPATMFLGAILVSLTSFAGGGGTKPTNPIQIYNCEYNAFEKVNGQWLLQNTSSYDTTNLGVACNVAFELCREYLKGLSKYSSNEVGCLKGDADPQILNRN